MTDATPQQFMKTNGLTVESEFVPFSRSRNADNKHRSLNWRVTLKHNGRDILTTDYSAGIGHCPAYKASVKAAGAQNSMLRHEAIELETETGMRASFRFNRPGRTNEKIEPSAADVFYSLIMESDALDYSTFEEWAENLGYDTDSRAAESIYRQCLEIALKLRNGIGDNLLTEARDVFSDY